MTGSTFQPKNTKQIYTNLQTIDYLVQTLGIDATGVNTILGLLETISTTGINKVPLIDYDEALLNIPREIGNTLVTLKGFSVYNPNNVDVFLKFWDFNNAIAPTVGVDTPELTIQIPALGSKDILGNLPIFETSAGHAIWIAATTGYLSTDNTAPATGLLSQILFNL